MLTENEIPRRLLPLLLPSILDAMFEPVAYTFTVDGLLLELTVIQEPISFDFVPQFQ